MKTFACWIKISANDKLTIFFFFYQKIRQFAWSVRSFFLGKVRKVLSICHLLNLSIAWYVLNRTFSQAVAHLTSSTLKMELVEDKLGTVLLLSCPQKGNVLKCSLTLVFNLQRLMANNGQSRKHVSYFHAMFSPFMCSRKQISICFLNRDNLSKNLHFLIYFFKRSPLDFRMIHIFYFFLAKISF